MKPIYRRHRSSTKEEPRPLSSPFSSSLCWTSAFCYGAPVLTICGRCLSRVLGGPADSGKLEAVGDVRLCAICFGQAVPPFLPFPSQHMPRAQAAGRGACQLEEAALLRPTQAALPDDPLLGGGASLSDPPTSALAFIPPVGAVPAVRGGEVCVAPMLEGRLLSSDFLPPPLRWGW